MSDLLERHEKPILESDPKGPKWQRGSVFNPAVLKIGDDWRMLYRATPTTEFGKEGSYASHIGVAESQDGITWKIRPEPLIYPTLTEEAGLGCEDPRATIVSGEDVGSAEIKIFYNAGELHKGWTKPKVRVMHATARNDLTELEKQGVFLATGSPDQVRIKAAALFPQPLPNGNWPFVFTMGSESPYGTLMYADHLTLEGMKKGISAKKLADMFLNTRDHNVLLAPPSPVERGPEIGAPPIKTDGGYVLFYCPANQSTEKTWGTGALLLNNTHKVIGQIDDLLVPEHEKELTGVVDNVAFSSGAVYLEDSDEVRIYYGGGDKGIYLATGKMKEIVNALKATKSSGDPNWPY